MMRWFPQKSSGRSLIPLLISVGVLSLPVLGEVEGEDLQGGSNRPQVVDLVLSQASSPPACPEAHINASTPCSIYGFVESISLEPTRISINISGQKFHYLMGSKTRWEKNSPLSLLMAAKVSRVPVVLGFENWGGDFYITTVRM